MLIGLLYIILFILFIYAPFVMLNWGWFLLLCIAYGVMGIGVSYGVIYYDAKDVPRILVAVGDIWLDAFPALAFTIITRAFILAAKYRGLRGWKLLGLNLIAILAPPAFIIGTNLIVKWERRPAPIACTSKQIPIDLAGLKGTIPWREAINLYLGNNIESDARYLFSPSSRRQVCTQTNNGKRSLPIKAITIKLRQSEPCRRKDLQEWETSVCKASTNKNTQFSFSEIVFFQSKGIELNGSGIMSIGMDGSFISIFNYFSTNDPTFGINDPTFGIVEFACRQHRDTYYCMSQFPITSIVDAQIEMYSSITDIDENFGKALSISKTIYSGIFE